MSESESLVDTKRRRREEDQDLLRRVFGNTAFRFGQPTLSGKKRRGGGGVAHAQRFRAEASLADMTIHPDETG